MAIYRGAAGERQVNAETPASLGLSDLVALSSGRFLVTWYDQSGQGPSRPGILMKGRLVEANGTPAGAEFTILDAASTKGIYTHVSAASNGGFLVAYTDPLSNQRLLARQYDAAGQPAGDVVTVATAAVPVQDNVMFFVSSALMSSGEHLISWAENGRYFQGGAQINTMSFRTARLDAALGKIGEPVTVVAANPDIAPQSSVAALGGNAFAFAWSDDNEVKVRIFQAGSSNASVEFQVSPTNDGSGSGSPIVLTLSDGNLAIIYSSGGDSYGLWAQVFTTAGLAIGPRTSIDQRPWFAFTTGATALAEGGFAVTWTARSDTGESDGSGSAIKVQRFTNTGVAQAPVEIANTLTFGDQVQPAIEAASGSYLIGWADYAAVNPAYGSARGEIMVRGFAAGDSSTAGDDVLTGTPQDDVLSGLAGNDTLQGLAGNDVLDGGAGIDSVSGDAGDDRLLGGADGDTLNGGTGVDIVDYSRLASGVTVTLAMNAADGVSTGTGAGGDQLISVEQVIGSAYGDVVSDSDVVTRVDLYGGDDTWRVGGSALRVLYGSGGEGFDTVEISNTYYNIAGSGLTGFERLVLQAGGNFQYFSGFQQITLAAPGISDNGGPGGQYRPGTHYNIIGSNNPLADLVVASQSLRLHSSTARSITGSAGGEMVSLANGAAVDQPIQLGAGDDRFTIDLLQGGVLPSFSYADGGEGKDVLEILTDNGTATTIAAGKTGGFESVLVNVGYVRAADVTLTGLVLNSGTLLVGLGTRLTLEPANLTGSLIQGAAGGAITISAGSTVGRYGLPDEGPYDRSVDLTGRDATLSVRLVNNGAITNGVKFYTGDDIYDGRGGFLAGDVYGNGGNDTLLGGAENERLFGGYGDDLLAGGRGNNTLSGGAGDDTASYADATAGVRVSLAVTGAQATGGAGTDTLSGIENLLGSAFGDVLTGDAGANRLTGGGGDDLLTGGRGNNMLVGGAGNDTAGYADATAGVRVSLAVTGAQGTGGAGTDTLSGIENLLGSAFGDMLTGDAGANRLTGGGGDDLLTGGAGNDVIDGGAGRDTASYSGLFRGVALSTAGGTTTISGAEGVDTLTGVEALQFTDGRYVLDADSDGAQLIRLYDSVLQRTPDAQGFDVWLDHMQARGMSLMQVAGNFIASAEFQVATGGLSNVQFVDYMYRHALGREADAGGRENWTRLLDNGAARAEMVVLFSESGEHRERTASVTSAGYFDVDTDYRTVALLYNAFNDRQPDLGGLLNWTQALKTGYLSLTGVAQGFVGSAEFQSATRGMDTGQLVDFMYHNTLLRDPDPVGRANWVNALDNGLSQADLLLGFALSTEHIANNLDQFSQGVVIG